MEAVYGLTVKHSLLRGDRLKVMWEQLRAFLLRWALSAGGGGPGRGSYQGKSQEGDLSNKYPKAVWSLSHSEEKENK